jgi:hypothetical protein
VASPSTALALIAKWQPQMQVWLARFYVQRMKTLWDARARCPGPL